MGQVRIDRLPQRELRFPGPAAREDAGYAGLVVSDVESEAYLLGAVPLEPTLDFVRLLHGGAAHDDAIDAIAQQVVHHCRRTHAAADLDQQRLLRSEPHDDAAIGES